MHNSSFVKFTFLCLIWLSTACEQQQPKHYINEGKLLFQQGDLETARVQLKNALQLDPKSSEPYYLLALIAEKQHNWGQMLKNLLYTVSNEPTHLEAQLRLGQLYLLGGKYEMAMEQAGKILALADDKRGHLLSAAVNLRQNNSAKAIQQIEHVLHQYPYDADAVALKVAYLNSNEQVTVARELLQQGIEHNPQDPELQLLKINLAINAERFDEAVDGYTVLNKMYPEKKGLRLALVDVLLTAKKQQEAESLLRQLIDEQPEDIALKHKLFNLVSLQNDSRSEKLLNQFIAAMPTESVWYFRLADYYLADEKLPAAERILQQFIDSLGNTDDALTASIKIARIALQQNDRSKMHAMLQHVLEVDNRHSDALLLRAALRIENEDYDGATADLRIVSANRPNSVKPLIKLAQIHGIKAEWAAAESQWRKILQIDADNVQAITQLSQLALKRGNHEQALKLLKQGIERSPNQIALQELWLQLKIKQKDWAAVNASLKSISSIPAATHTAQYWQAIAYEQQGLYQQAILQYQQLLNVLPDNGKALKRLTVLSKQLKQLSELVNYLQNLIQQHGKLPPLVNQLVSVLGIENKGSQAEILLLQAINENPADQTLKFSLLALTEKLNIDESKNYLLNWIQQHPENPVFKLRLANIYLQQESYQQAENILRQISDSHSGKLSFVAEIKLAQSAARQNQADLAFSIMDKLIDKTPWFNPALLQRAVLFVKQQKFQPAIDDLTTALNNNQADLAVLEMLTRVYQEIDATDKLRTTWEKILQFHPGHYAALNYSLRQLIQIQQWNKADKLLNKALIGNENDPKLLVLKVQLAIAKKDWLSAENTIRLLKHSSTSAAMGRLWQAHLANAQGQADKAMELYKAILIDQPNDQAALIAIGQVAEKSNQHKQLIIFLQELLKHHPDIDIVNSTLALSYAVNKNWLASERLLKQMLQKNPQHIKAYQLLSRTYQAQNKLEDAEKLYLKALNDTHHHVQIMNELARFYLQQNQPEKSIAWYQKLLDKYPQHHQAANNLADLLISYQPGQDNIEQALKLVQRFKFSKNSTTLDTYGWINLKAGNISVALDSLTQAVNTTPGDARLRYHLAEAYQQSGDIHSARQEIEKSLSLARQDGEFLDIAAAHALKQKLDNKI